LSAPRLQQGEVVVMEAAQTIPGDGDIVEGIASVDESAITGESAPVILEPGGEFWGRAGSVTWPVIQDADIRELVQLLDAVAVPRSDRQPAAQGFLG
jgi:K+-transporting ATPase ATPase B chain